MSLSAEIGWAVMHKLAEFKGCDIKEIVQDDGIYEDIVDSVIDIIETKLQRRVDKLTDKIEYLLLDVE